MLTGTQLTVVRQNRALVSEVDFSAKAGEMTVILGRNGAGKSTLLRCLSGELKPTSGSVSLFDRSLPEWKLIELARVRAVVAQSSPLSFPFKVREVVELGRGPHNGGADSIIDEALDQLDLLPLQDRDYTTLSGGERQRTHFARALAQIHEALQVGKGFLLLDEPTSSLDLAHQHQALRCAKALTQRGLGVVAVMHDLNLTVKYADTVYLLDEGICLANGPANEVLDPALLSRAYRIPIQKTSDIEVFDVKN